MKRSSADDCEPVDAMTARELIVAIDGPSAAGKSSAGTLVARRLGYLYVESGAFYRALAWKVRERGLDPTDDAALRAFCETTVIEVMRTPAGVRILVDRRDVTDELLVIKALLASICAGHGDEPRP